MNLWDEWFTPQRDAEVATERMVRGADTLKMTDMGNGYVYVVAVRGNGRRAKSVEKVIPLPEARISEIWTQTRREDARP